MAFQTTVNREQAMGVVGELFDTSIRRVTPYALAADSVIGGAAWLTANGKATGTYDASTANKLLGIFVNPKEYTNFGGNVAEPTLVMKASTIGQVADMGHVIIKASVAVAVGDDVYVVKTTGAFTNVADGNTKVGKCVRVGSDGANQTIVLQIEVA